MKAAVRKRKRLKELQHRKDKSAAEQKEMERLVYRYSRKADSAEHVTSIVYTFEMPFAGAVILSDLK